MATASRLLNNGECPPTEYIVETYYYDPVGYAIAILGITPRCWQAKYMMSVALNQRTACKSGRGVGKTKANAMLIHWFMATRFEPKIIVTANTEKQLKTQTWAELAMINRSALNGELFEWAAEKFYLKEHPESWWAVPLPWQKEKPESFAGQHRDNFLLIFDEASSIPGIIFETGAGSINEPQKRWAMTGNPTRPSGDFYQAFHKDRKLWNCLTVNYEEVEGLSKDFPTFMSEKYGKHSNAYKIWVSGEFPDQADDSLISLAMVEMAMARQVYLADSSGELIIGVDVARFGDDSTVILPRRNRIVPWLEEYFKINTMEIVGRIIIAMQRAQEHFGQPVDAIHIDVIGMGAGVVDRLREKLEEIGNDHCTVREVNVAEATKKEYRGIINIRAEDGKSIEHKPPQPERHRDELWWCVREWLLNDDPSIVDDSGLLTELVSPCYKVTSSGKIKIEGKDEMKKRGLSSPNKADALGLTFSQDAGPGVGVLNFMSQQADLARKRREEEAKK
jgi:phage terminase large subunit